MRKGTAYLHGLPLRPLWADSRCHVAHSAARAPPGAGV